MFFTSDTHFGHANIIGYCVRPFENVHVMNKEMTRLWNETVGPDDLVYHLGDFAFGSKNNAQIYRSYLNGHIVLVRGNHDKSKGTMLSCGFDDVVDELCLTFDDIKLYLRHKPEFDSSLWNGASHHLCGHVHERWAMNLGAGKPIINVGVDQRGFKPRTLEELGIVNPVKLIVNSIS